jgi:serpin B
MAHLEATGRRRRTPAPDAPVDRFVDGVETFGLAAERIVARDGGNTVLSPLGIAVAFAMAQAGARGETASRLAAVFGFPDGAGLHEAVNAVTAAVGRAGGTGEHDPEVALANSLWLQSGFDVEPAYLDVLADSYGAAVQLADFVHGRGGARRAINDWVALATRGRIAELVADGALGEATRLVLVDAVYLRAAWATPFPDEATTPAPFHPPGAAPVEVPTMHVTLPLGTVAQGDGYTAVRLPYVPGTLAMDVVVPDVGTTVDDLTERAGGRSLAQAGWRPARVELALPSWTTRAALDLGPVLTELGLPVPGGSLDGIAPELEIGAAVHAADITVDEHGTEAAAATAVMVSATGAIMEGDTVTVRADRPFLAVVRHVRTGAPLFLGRVTDPTRPGTIPPPAHPSDPY